MSKELGAGGRFDIFLDSAFRKYAQTEFQIIALTALFYM